MFAIFSTDEERIWKLDYLMTWSYYSVFVDITIGIYTKRKISAKEILKLAITA